MISAYKGVSVYGETWWCQWEKWGGWGGYLEAWKEITNFII